MGPRHSYAPAHSLRQAIRSRPRIRTCFFSRHSGARALVPVALLAALPCPARTAAAQYEWTSSRPDGHAPIGVMADHVHSKGEFMASYRFMRMAMGGNRMGTNEVSTQDVLESFMVSPTEMTMDMHMAGLMYAPSDAVTLVAMLNWTRQSMNHATRMGGSFESASSGMGDAAAIVMVRLKKEGAVRAHLNLGIGVPTGSIEQTGAHPMSMGRAVQMPYPMQLGSGTWDAMPGMTILGMGERTSWGLQGSGLFRLGENARGYRKGHGAEATSWFGVKLSDRASLSARILARRLGNYSGADAAYGNPTMVPTVRTELRGGTRIDLPVGLNAYFPDGPLKGHRIAAEWSLPLYQDLDGPQLQTDWTLVIGWQKSFGPPGHGR